MTTSLPRATWPGTDLLSPRGGVSELLVSRHVGCHYYMATVRHKGRVLTRFLPQISPDFVYRIAYLRLKVPLTYIQREGQCELSIQ